jgi:hypothetical protein
MSKPAYDSLDDFFHDIDTYRGGWDQYCAAFLRSPVETRVVELSAFDQLLEGQTSVSRQTAERIQMRRQIGDIHQTLLRAGR